MMFIHFQQFVNETPVDKHNGSKPLKKLKKIVNNEKLISILQEVCSVGQIFEKYIIALQKDQAPFIFSL